MRTKILIIMVFTLMLSACSGAATQPPASPTAEAVQPVMTETAIPTVDPGTFTVPPTQAAPPTEDLPTQAPSSSGAVTYKLDPTQSQLQYEVAETFLNDNNRLNLAKGVTSQVSGEIIVDLAVPKNSQIGTITADISQFKSDSSRRDNAIRGRYLESSKYPTVTFVPTRIEGLPDAYTDGQEIPLKISGDLTIREVTRPVDFEATIKLDGSTLSGVATTTILMSDFKFGPISILGMLNTEDQAKVTLTFVAHP
jgi:polyisoprenoid-binding protein YceI